MADASFDYSVAQAKAVYDQLGEWIDRYHGGLPAGFLAAIITHESGGNFLSAGDPVLGEVGYLQVAAYIPPLFGYPAEARTDPESNIAIGVLEYELEAAYWAARYPEVNLGSADNWKLARLAFAVGRGGSYQLANMARASFGALTQGDVYHDIVKVTSAAGGVPLGSQSAAKVLARVVDIDRQWAIGKEVNSAPPGPPLYIPDPPAGPYTIPENAAHYFSKPIPVTIILAVGLGVVAWLLYKGY